MRLARFIEANSEEIISEWERFARTLEPSASSMDSLALQDHAAEILTAVSLDLDTLQSSSAQFDKSQGKGLPGNANSAAAVHGKLRQLSGFTLVQLTSEFRALRACVLRLWMPTVDVLDNDVSQDVLRFNESMDQALGESATTFSGNANRARDTFLAILGHDLRTPLSAIAMAGALLERSPADTQRNVATGKRLRRSAATMSSMVNDLLEYARTQLGGKMPMTPLAADMRDICRAAIEDARAAYPDCVFEAEESGDLSGTFDSVRLQQVITNLLANAAQYRSPDSPVRLRSEASAGHVSVRVSNLGAVIPPEALQIIFTPMVQLDLADGQTPRQTASLGLGLFIARQTTLAHQGEISVASSRETGTAFTIRIPRVFDPLAA